MICFREDMCGRSVDYRNSVHVVVCMLSPTTIGEDTVAQRAQDVAAFHSCRSFLVMLWSGLTEQPLDGTSMYNRQQWYYKSHSL